MNGFGGMFFQVFQNVCRGIFGRGWRDGVAEEGQYREEKLLLLDLRRGGTVKMFAVLFFVDAYLRDVSHGFLHLPLRFWLDCTILRQADMKGLFLELLRAFLDEV